MKICGVIAEYNPFHNGHAYQLAEARRLSGCDYLIVVMGGAFSQRGEVMLTDKWLRTQMALSNGADLVIELPALFAVQSADRFAWGGVKILAGLGADSICFGCETDDLFLLNRTLDLLLQETDELKEGIRLRLQEGMSHVRARGEAAEALLCAPSGLLSRPNTALALEYMRVNRSLAQPMTVYPVLRTSGYHDAQIHAMASASAIRSSVYRGETEEVRAAMPENAFALLKSRMPGGLADMSRLDALLIDRLRTLGPEGIRQLADIGEGLEHRAARCAEEAGSREDFLALIKCKRYTHARLSRLSAHALLGLTKELCARHPEPEYARVLGFRRDAAALVTHLSQSAMGLVSRPAALKDSEMFAVERRATDLQALCFTDKPLRAAGRDLTEKMIVV